MHPDDGEVRLRLECSHWVLRSLAACGGSLGNAIGADAYCRVDGFPWRVVRAEFTEAYEDANIEMAAGL